MEIDAVRKRHCYNCGEEGHYQDKCKKPKKECGECKFLGGKHKYTCSKYKGERKSARSAEKEHSNGEGQDPRMKALKGMNFDALEAFFKDKQVLDKKGKGRATGTN